MKVDLYATHKAEYIAPKKPEFVKVGPAHYLAIEGTGAPGEPQFQESIGALYATAYTIKMTSKFAGKDYKVCPLEGLYWGDIPKEWHWKLLIRTPDFIGRAEWKAAQQKLAAKQNPLVPQVKLEKLKEGKCVQMLHVGPYDRVGETFTVMRERVEEEGLALHGLHHEVYLNDPRRVKPEKLKTILRMPVGKA